jgi:arylsulfatase A-like enzyme
VAYHGDLMATVGELCSARIPAGVDSISIAPTLLGKSDRQKQHEYLYWEFHERKFSQAVRMGKWKAVRYLRDNTQLELYDLEQDVGEEHNVAADHPDLTATLAAVMEQAHVEHPEWPVPEAPAVAEDEKPGEKK